MAAEFEKEMIEQDARALKNKVDEIEKRHLSRVNEGSKGYNNQERFDQVLFDYYIYMKSCSHSFGELTLKDMMPLTKVVNDYFEFLYRKSPKAPEELEVQREGSN